MLSQQPKNPQPTFWRDKRVLLTGHTGFKGSWLAAWLNRLGAQVTGIGLPPATEPNLFSLAQLAQQTHSHQQDIRDADVTAAIVRAAEPEIVFHLAAQPLVRASYRDPLVTFATNTQGTANLLDAIRDLTSTKVIVAITTDSLGGHDPYSASKAAAELVIASYRDAFLAEQGVAVASARAGNVIGGGDWSEDRLIPDAVRAWSSGQTLYIRRPEAIRPWQHVLEPLAGYLRLAERLWDAPELASAWNFGPPTFEAATVRAVIEQAWAAWSDADSVHAEVTWGDGSEGPHESGWLALETAKARTRLGVQPRWSLHEGIERTMHWYRRQGAGESAIALCEQDIAAYQAAATDATRAPRPREP